MCLESSSWSLRAVHGECLKGLLKHAWLDSGGVYDYCKLALDERDSGEAWSKHQVAKLLRTKGLRAQHGYGKRPRAQDSALAVLVPNLHQQQFSEAGRHLEKAGRFANKHGA